MKRLDRIALFASISLGLASATLGCRKEKAQETPPVPTAAPADAPVPTAPIIDAAAAPTAAPAAAPESLVAGDYACGFGSYPDFLCRITEDGNFISLEKLGGTERFSGSLSKGDEGTDIRFTNAGKDAAPAELLFKRQADGTWLALIPADGEKIGYRLRYLGELASQFGGQTYAGAISAPTWKE